MCAMKPLRMGIAGSGFGRKVLWPVFSEIEGVSVVALTGSPVTVPSNSAPTFFPSWREMILSGTLDVVALALPPLVQEEAARVALEKGVHLFCEKPLALHADAAEKLLRAAEERKRSVVVDFEFRKIPVFQRLRESVARVGGLQSVEVEWLVANRDRRITSGSWKCEAARGGGAMNSFGCHLVDLCSAMFGRLEVIDYRTQVHVSEYRSEDGSVVPNTAEDEFHLELHTQEKVPVRIHVNTAHSTQKGLLVRIQGERGALTLTHRHPENYFGGFDLTLDHPDAATEFLERSKDNDSGDARFRAVREVAKEFIEAIRKGGVPECHLGIGVENSRLIASARNRIK